MDTKALRQKILDLAIHGKLVPQNSSDEPASVLLQRIREEKERLIKEGKIKKGKKTKGTSDTAQYGKVPFKVPSSWEWTTLGEIGTWQAGATPSRLQKDYYGGNIPWLKTGDLIDGIITCIPENITEKAVQETSVKLNPTGSVLIAMYGATIGKIGILAFPATTNQACCACVDYKVEQMYLFYFLLANRNNFIAMGGGGAQPNISKDKIINALIPLPPLGEQKRIVEEIKRQFSLINIIENGKANIKSAVQQAKSKILDLAIHGKLVPQDPSDEPAAELLRRIREEKEQLIKEGKIKKGKKTKDTSDTAQYGNLPYEVPNGWEWTTVGDVSKSILYGVSESAKSVGGYKLLRITDIQDNDVNWNSVPYTDYDVNKAENYLLKDGDILFARTGATVGKSYLVKGLIEKTIYASYLIRVQTYDVFMPEYVKYFFESGYYWEQIQVGAVGVGQPNVNGTILSKLNIPLPPLAEQHRIVAKIEQLFAQLDSIEAKL